jgi:hypothetical protein
VPPNTLLEDLAKLINNKDLSDVSFILEGTLTAFYTKLERIYREESLCAQAGAAASVHPLPCDAERRHEGSIHV